MSQEGKALALTALLFFSVPTAAHGGEDELLLAAELGAAPIARAGELGLGITGDATAWLGLTDALWATGSLGLTRIPSFETQGLLYHGFLGVAAAFDVFEAVPFAEVAVGIVGAGDLVRPSARVGIGLDWFVARTLSFGGVVRYSPLFEERLGDHLITAELRLGMRLEL